MGDLVVAAVGVVPGVAGAQSTVTGVILDTGSAHPGSDT